MARIDIAAAIKLDRQERMKARYPVRSNWASRLGHKCLRHLVHHRLHWDKAIPADEFAQGKFDDGHMHENEVLIALQRVQRKCGFAVIRQQDRVDSDPFFLSRKIAGKVDAIFQDTNDRQLFVGDVKSMMGAVYNKINTVDDLLNSRSDYLRNYVDQVYIYELGFEIPDGFLILKNKDSGDIKQIDIELDYSRAEELVSRADETNEYVKKNELPERIPYCKQTCGWCEYRHICKPAIPENSLHIIDKPDFIEQIERHYKTQTNGKEFASLDKKVKDILKQSGKDRLIVGEFLCTCKVSSNKAQTWTIQKLKGSDPVAEPQSSWTDGVVDSQVEVAS